MAVRFNFSGVTIKIDIERYRKIVKRIIENEGFIVDELTVNIISDEELVAINKRFLCKDYLTDTISFSSKKKDKLSGDIFISFERVKENSKKYSKNSFLNEFNRILIHSVLHVVGYNDKSADDYQSMITKENYYIKKLILQEK